VGLARLMMEEGLPWYEEGGEVAVKLEAGLREAGYTGAVGVDALVYRERGTGTLRVRDVVEVNPRYTMGRVALELGKRVAPGRWCRFALAPCGAWEGGKVKGGKVGIGGCGESIVAESTSPQPSPPAERESEEASPSLGEQMRWRIPPAEREMECGQNAGGLVELDAEGKMSGGRLVLNDGDRAERVVAVLEVGKRWEEFGLTGGRREK
jgi:hypothetical protein